MHSCSSTCSGSAATRHFRSQAAAQLLKGEPHGLGMWATSEVPAPERLSMMRVCRRGVLNSGFLFTFQVWGKRGLFFRARGRFCKVKRWGGRGSEVSIQLAVSANILFWLCMETAEPSVQTGAFVSWALITESSLSSDPSEYWLTRHTSKGK